MHVRASQVSPRRPLPVSGRLRMSPARSGCPKPGKEEGGDARYSYRLGSGRRIMGRRNMLAYLPILNYIMQSINVNDKFLLLL